MKKLSTTVIISCISLFCNAQDTKSSTVDLVQLSKKIEGTYQIQSVNSRQLPTLHIREMEVIQNKRHASDTVYYFSDQNTRVLILPEKVISDPDFVKIALVAK